MNIGNGIENLPRIFEAQTVTRAVPAKSAGVVQNDTQKSDQAQLSATANHATQSVADSDVRLDKVASIQGALQAGTYSVPASSVAQKLIGSMLTDK